MRSNRMSRFPTASRSKPAEVVMRIARRACWAYGTCAALVLLAALAWGLAGNRRAAAAGDRDGAGAGPAPTAPQVGKTATVYLRGDASGIAFGDRVPGLGNLLSLRGTIEAADAQWLVVKEDRGGRRFHVSTASVLAVADDAE